MDGSDFVAVGADPAHFRYFLDLIAQDGFLNSTKQALGILHHEAEVLWPDLPSRARDAVQAMGSFRPVFESRLDNNPYIHGGLPI